jgi:hypothetical protein
VCTRAQQAEDPAALMAASQERYQHDAGSPGLGELVRFSAEPQLAELRCLGGGAAVRQGIGLQPAAAAAAGTSSGSAAAVTCTDAQVASHDYQLIQHVKEPSIDVTAEHAESDLSVMPALQMGDGSLNRIDDIQPVTKLNETAFVEDTPQVSIATRLPVAAHFAIVLCQSSPAPFASAGCRLFYFCLACLHLALLLRLVCARFIQQRHRG